MWRINFLTLAKGVAQFVAYRTEHMDHPDTWQDPDRKGKPAVSPYLQQVKLTLVGRLGYSEEQAMDTPLSKAMFDFFGYWEQEGQMTLVGDEMSSLQEELANEQSAVQREMAEFNRKVKEGQGRG